MELALCLAAGLDLNGISILYKSAKPALQVSLLPLLALSHRSESRCLLALIAVTEQIICDGESLYTCKWSQQGLAGRIMFWLGLESHECCKCMLPCLACVLSHNR